MNRTARKCQHCKKSLPTIQDGQKYCSNRCRQAAYRKRHTGPRHEKKPVERVLSLATCEHCQGGFFATTKRGRFCSTACRSMYHREMKARLADVLIAEWGNATGDWIDKKPMKQLRALVESHGYVYHHDQRRWVQV